jgi:CheY-like chemotaxis protein/signal transduction histidine kinase
MMIFRKLKIGKRLTLGFIVILTFSMVTSIVAIFQINTIWSDTQNLYQHPFMVSNLLRDIKINALNIRRYMLDMAILKDKEKIDELEGLINNEESSAFENYDKITELYYGDKKLIGQSYQFFKNWKPLRDDVIALVKNGNAEKSSDYMVERNREYVRKLFVQMQALIDTTSKSAETFYISTLTTKNDIMKVLIGLLLFSLAVSILLAYLITKSISQPLTSIVQNIRAIARGNLDNQKLPEEPDEIGELSISYNLMQENLIEKASVAEKIAQGNFSAHITPGGENDRVAKSINMIAENFGLVVKQARKVAEGNFETEIAGIAKTNQLAVVITQMLDSLKEVVAKARQVAKGDYSGEIIPKSSSDELAFSLNQMTVALRNVTAQNLRQNRLKTAQNDLNEKMRGDLGIDQLSKNVITFIARHTNAQIGAIYLYNEDEKAYQLKASYAFLFRKGIRTYFKEGEGLVGQAAMEKEILTFGELPDDYLKITSGTGETVPRSMVVTPFIYEEHTIGVIELGSVSAFTDETYEFLRMVLENVAISLTSAINRTKMAKLLQVTREQSEELQVQQEELKQTNEELEEQTQALRRSEESLQAQQEELRVTNEDLEYKTHNLEKQKDQMEKQNHELEIARTDVENKAKELEITNKYKSEFLANMSHELRTPLNSLLLLSESLIQNKEQNLNPQQIQSAQIIYNSGNDLLRLINDILDLSKIESGKMRISLGNVSLSDIQDSILDSFKLMLREKKLHFKSNVGNNLPDKIFTDEQRLYQILRNLISNAIKFTEKGEILLNIFKPENSEDLSRSGLSPSEAIAFSVKDTGIGIAKEKQQEIFEAFQQADGGISRKYGGTGLGLSITRELTRLLGGEIKLISAPGEGSDFIVFLPLDANEKMRTLSKPSLRSDIRQTILPDLGDSLKINKGNYDTPGIYMTSIPDDRQNTSPGDHSILIIEDDASFAEILVRICRDKGFKCIIAPTGEEGIELAGKFIPKGIILDIKLPGMSGWDVLERLKSWRETRHIPVHVISGNKESMEAFNKGAIGFLTKPVTKEKLEFALDELQSFITRKIKDLLVIEDDENLQKSIKNLLEATDISISECTTGKRAIELISTQNFDCIVLDLGLPDMSGFEMLKFLKENNIKIPPVVVYTGREISSEENDELQNYTRNIIIKGIKSEERLLDETALFLHRVVDEMPDRQRKMLVSLYDKDLIFHDKCILIVDDDMRNVFAITQVLEASDMKVIMAPNGEKALEILDKHPSVHLILMDIMMPVMDGYETMKRIREDQRFLTIPIIALTAKAMKDDREKSIAAGANDYLSKPVDIQKLFNLMRIWLYQ